MTLLWVTNTIFPEFALEIGIKPPVVGGWMYGLANDLANKKSISLHIATATKDASEIKISKNNKTYHLISGTKSNTHYDTSLEPKWQQLVNEIKPDIIHIHGTEYAHGLSLMNSCKDENYIVSIQGLVGVYERYFLGGLSTYDIIRNITLRDLLKKDTLFQGKKKYRQRGIAIEVNYLKQTKHVIGRTSWDRSHALTVNPNCQYHFCNESLRDSFYKEKKWSVKTMKPYTIFLSQASMPIKGLHKVLEALAIVKNKYPNVLLKIAGGNILSKGNLKSKLRRKGYAKLVGKIIKKNTLEKHVTFTGFLDENEMANEYLNANVFICPSSIENSPNSVGEAQILGVPTIASYVGGVSDMVTHSFDGLIYRFEEVEMLAEHIHTIFGNIELAKKLSENGILTSQERHHRENNLKQLLSIYKSIR